MQRNKIKFVFSLFASLVLALMITGARAADAPARTGDQNKKSSSLKTHLGSVQLEAAHIKVHRKPAVAFKSHDCIDPKTNKVVSPDTMIEVGGTRMRAGDYR